MAGTAYDDEILSDDALREAVLAHLFHSFPALREIGQCFDAEVRDGKVILKGWVRTETIRDLAQEAATEVGGVKAVIVQLIADEEIEREVALALEQDARTVNDFPGIFVDAYCGEVKIWGAVSHPEDVAVAEKIVSGVKDVRAVRNELKVKESIPI